MPPHSPSSVPPSGPITTLDEAAAYLEGLINHERRSDFAYARLDLRPIEALLDAIGRPHDRLSVVHVAGSKGKGSTCLYVESILRALGRSVGTFTSPHLESWVERFRIDGRPVDPGTLAAVVERIRPPVDRLRAGPAEQCPSFFDATTAVAFLLFAEAGVDRAVIEVGLGGRLDSTNVVAPAVTCITGIELEHTDKLGPTEAAIAGEKAGILKPGVVAVLGLLGPEAEEVIRARAKAVGAPVEAFGEAFWIEPVSSADDPASPDAPGSEGGFRYREGGGLTIEIDALASPGAPARRNAALALACVRALRAPDGSPAHDDGSVAAAARRALSAVRLPGRIERLAGDPRVVVDAAHTARSARALAEALEVLAPDGFELLLSVSSDKDLAALLGALLPRAARIVTTRADPFRSLDPERLAEGVRALRGDVEVVAVEDPARAAREARAGLAEGRLLCATGSVYLAGIVRRTLGGAGDGL